MKWRYIGILLLLLSLLFAGLHVEFPVGKSNVVLEENGVPLVFVYPSVPEQPFQAELNVTLNPFNKTGYVVEAFVRATVWNSTPQNATLIDFWVVNNTGWQLLVWYLGNNTYLSAVEQLNALPGVKAYAKGIDKAIMVLRFQGLDYNGNYTVVLINPYRDTVANVSIIIEETWMEAGRFIEPNVVSVSAILGTAVLGLYVAVKNPRWLSKKTKGRTR